MAGPKEIWDKAYEIANLLSKVNALAEGMDKLADSVEALNERLVRLEASIDTLRAESRLDAVREAQSVVNSVQSQFHAQIVELAVKVARMANSPSSPDGIGQSDSCTRLSHDPEK